MSKDNVIDIGINNSELVVSVIDGVGRSLIGKLHMKRIEESMHKPAIMLFEPALMIQRQAGEGQVSVTVQPISNVEFIDEMCVTWTTIHKCTSKFILDQYENFLNQLKAARAGITLATTIPKNAVLPTKN